MSDESNSEKSFSESHIKMAIGAITAVVTIVSSVLLYTSNTNTVQIEVHKNNLEIAREYQETNRQLIKENTEKTIKVLELELKIRNLSNRKGTIESYIEDIPAPVWIKKINKKGQFEMLHLNRQYLKVYGISKFGYIGKTDYDFWPKETADTFQKEDLEVFLHGLPVVRLVKIPKGDGKFVQQLFMKFRVNLEGGEHGVGGILLDTTVR